MMIATLAALTVFMAAAPPAATPPTREQVEAEMGLRSQGDDVRGQLDTVGFAVTAAQMEDVVARAREVEAELFTRQSQRYGLTGEAGLVAGICPHDDYLYAGRAYVYLTDHIRAPRVLLLGVFHKAREWDLEGKLVFDRFRSWHGPWAPVPVDPLREELLELLPHESVVVDNAMHCREHSLEAIVPFLQASNRDVRIVPVLVPYMGWEDIERISEQLATALATLVTRHGWQLGRDLAVVISSDAVHYGKDFDHSPFGLDASGYQTAFNLDATLSQKLLEGQLNATKSKALFEDLVDPDDVRHYRIPWCGRFSIPVGLETLRRLAGRLGQPVPVGHMLRHASSISDLELPVSKATRDAGLGTTAESNLCHWVDYLTVGYKLPAVVTPPAAGTGG